MPQPSARPHSLSREIRHDEQVYLAICRRYGAALRDLEKAATRRSRRVDDRAKRRRTPLREALARRETAALVKRVHFDMTLHALAKGHGIPLYQPRPGGKWTPAWKQDPMAAVGWGDRLRRVVDRDRGLARSLPPPVVMWNARHATLPATPRIRFGKLALEVWDSLERLRERWNAVSREARRLGYVRTCFYAFEIVRCRERPKIGQPEGVKIHVHALVTLPRDAAARDEARRGLQRLWRESARPGELRRSTTRVIRNRRTGRQDADSREWAFVYVSGLLRTTGKRGRFPKPLAAYLEPDEWLPSYRAKDERDHGPMGLRQLWMHFAFYSHPRLVRKQGWFGKGDLPS